MRFHYLPIIIFSSTALADYLTSIDGQQCTVRSSLVPVGPGQTSTPGQSDSPGQTSTLNRSIPTTTTGGASTTDSATGLPITTDTTGSQAPTDTTLTVLPTDTTSSPVPTSTGITTTTASDSTQPATTTTADRSGTAPLPGPIATNANGVPVYSDRAVCGAIFETDPTDFYGIYCNAAAVSNTLLQSYTMNADLSPANLDQCVISCSLISNPSVPNGICQAAVFYNGTDVDAPVCNLYGAMTSNKRDTQDSTLSLVYALDSYTGLPMSTVDSDLPPAPLPPGQEPSSTTTVTSGPTSTPVPTTSSTTTDSSGGTSSISSTFTTSSSPSPTVSASPSPSPNGTTLHFVLKPRTRAVEYARFVLPYAS